MTASEALYLAEKNGVDIRMSDDGVYLMLHGDKKPESDLLTALFTHKDDILVLLRDRQRVVEIDAASLNAKVIREIADIEADALALGWGFDRLWHGNMDTCQEASATPGLAAVMIRGDHVTEVTSEFIRIHRTRGDRLTGDLYFFRCDA